MKILFLDIEIAPRLGYVWGLWNNNISLKQLAADTYILNWGAAWLGEDEVMFDALHYHKRWKSDPQDDYEVCASIWKLLDEADIVVAHNGDQFDTRVLNGRFLKHGMEPPSTYRTIDTLKIARRKFKLASNKLDFLATYLGLGEKIDTGGFELWRNIVENQCTESFDKMVAYCNHDVELLEEVYLALRAWDDKHPAVVTIEDPGTPICNACGSDNVKKNGTYATNTQIYQKYKCSDCGHNLRSRQAEKLKRSHKRNILRSL